MRQRKELDGQLSLFDAPPPIPKAQRDAADVLATFAAGFHPTTGLPLAPSKDMRCDGCKFRARKRRFGIPVGRSFCQKARFYGGGQRERVTKDWRGCILYEPAHGLLGEFIATDPDEGQPGLQRGVSAKEPARRIRDLRPKGGIL